MKKQNINNEKYKNCKTNSDVGARLCPCPSRPNTQKGITLIALIITIIILLILAVVSIRLVVNNGILGKAEHAVDEYSKAEADEQDQLLKAEYEMAKYEGKYSGTYTDYVLEKKYGVKIGDYVAYTPSTETYASPTGTHSDLYESVPRTIEQGNGWSEQIFNTSSYTGGWRVLGVDDRTGELQLISADNIKTSTESKYYLRGYTGATYGEKELNNICAIYGKGEHATGARSVNVDDVNQITGYNPERTGDGKPCNSGSISEYGNEVTYTWGTSSSAVTYSGTNGETGSGSSSAYSRYGFNYHDENWNWRSVSYTSGSPICTLKLTNYTYFLYSLTNDYNGTQVGISKTSPEYYTLCYNSCNKGINYWLASPYVGTNGYAIFGLRYLGGGSSGFVNQCELYDSRGNTSDTVIYISDIGVRPVVSLKSDIKIEKTETNDGSTLEKACIIK